MPITTAIVPAAGWGSRMRPLTDAVPKELLPLGRKAALQHIVAELVATGISRIILVTSPRKEPIFRAAFARVTGVEIIFAVQQSMRGLGDAVTQAKPFVPRNTPMLLVLGDAVISEPTLGGLASRLIQSCGDVRTIGLAVQEVPLDRVSRYGVVKPTCGTSGTAFAIETIVEKPAPEIAPSRYAAAARYVLPFALFDTLAETPADAKGEIQLTDALKTLLASGSPGVAVPLSESETRHDIGGFDSYYRAFATFAAADALIPTQIKEPIAV